MLLSFPDMANENLKRVKEFHTFEFMKMLVLLLFLIFSQSYSQSPTQEQSGNDMKQANRSPRAQEQYRLGMKHYKKGDYSLALTFFQMAEGLDANATDADLYIKKINAASNPTRDTLTSLEQNKSMSGPVPNDMQRYYYLGVTAAKNNESERAKKYFEKTIAQDTNHRKAHIGLGNLYLADKEKEKALAHFESAYSLDATDLKVAAKLLDIYKDLGAKYEDNYICFKKKVDSLKIAADN